MRARDLGLACGSLPPGQRNSIADVPGVLVGHATLIDGDVCTGVTAVLPHDGDLFQDRPLAAVQVLNGFGKSVGLVQVAELGTLETPVLLTNTFAVGTCANALIRRAVRDNPEIGRQTSTVNAVVLECNDGYLNDIQAMAVTEADAEAAIASAAEEFAAGAVGAGAGMSCFGLKGGIGSASRRIKLDGEAYHLGVLVLANFGRAGELRLPDGRRIGAGGRRRRGGRVLHRADRHRYSAGMPSARTGGAAGRRWSGVVRCVLGQRQRRHRAGLHHRQPGAARGGSGFPGPPCSVGGAHRPAVSGGGGGDAGSGAGCAGRGGDDGGAARAPADWAGGGSGPRDAAEVS